MSRAAPSPGGAGRAAPRAARSSQSRLSRSANVTGVARDGTAPPRPAVSSPGASPAPLAARAVKRPHATSPDRHRSSSHSGRSRPRARAAPPLPGARRDLEALELLDHGEEAAPALELRPRRHVLPAQQEAHEVLRRHRLDLAAQAIRRVAVDAGEEAPLAALDSRSPSSRSGSKRPRSAKPSASSLARALLDGAHGPARRARPARPPSRAPGLEVPARRRDRGRLLVDLRAPARPRRRGQPDVGLDGARPGRARRRARRRSVASQSAPSRRDGDARRARSGRSSSNQLDHCGARAAARPARAARRAARRRRAAPARPRRARGRSRRGRGAPSSRALLGQAAAERHRARAALLERRVVEEGVGPAVQDLVRQRRRLGRVDEVERGSRRASMRFEHADEAVDVHRLVQAVVQRLAHERVVGDLDGTGAGVLLAGGLRREDRGQQVVGLHALDRRRDCACRRAGAAPRARGRGSSASAPGTSATSSTACASVSARRPRREEARHVLEREAVLRAEREHDGVVAGRGLQLEVEATQKRLRSARPERAVDAAAERRVHDELHAARLVEEALEDDVLLGRHDAERAAPAPEVARRSARRRRRRGRTRARATPARAGASSPRGSAPTRARRSPTPRPTARRVRAGASPSQNGIVGGAPWASTTRTTPRLDAADAPRGAAEQEDVARHALDGEVLVDRADEGVVGLGDDAGSRRSPGSRRREVRAASARRAGRAARRYAVAVEVARRAGRGRSRRLRASISTTSSKSARGEVARKGAARRTSAKSSSSCQSSAGARRRRSAAPGCRAARRAAATRSSRPARTRAEERRALDQLVARDREEAALGRRARARGPSGRRAAGTSRGCAASRSGRRGRRGRCRCPARARRSRRAPAARPP